MRFFHREYNYTTRRITAQWIRKRLLYAYILYINMLYYCVCEITLRLRGRTHCPLHKIIRWISLFPNAWQLYTSGGQNCVKLTELYYFLCLYYFSHSLRLLFSIVLIEPNIKGEIMYTIIWYYARCYLLCYKHI